MDIVHILNVAHKEAVSRRNHFLAYLIGMALTESKKKHQPVDRLYERRKA